MIEVRISIIEHPPTDAEHKMLSLSHMLHLEELSSGVIHSLIANEVAFKLMQAWERKK